MHTNCRSGSALEVRCCSLAGDEPACSGDRQAQVNQRQRFRLSSPGQRGPGWPRGAGRASGARRFASLGRALASSVSHMHWRGGRDMKWLFDALHAFCTSEPVLHDRNWDGHRTLQSPFETRTQTRRVEFKTHCEGHGPFRAQRPAAPLRPAADAHHAVKGGRDVMDFWS